MTAVPVRWEAEAMTRRDRAELALLLAWLALMATGFTVIGIVDGW